MHRESIECDASNLKKYVVSTTFSEGDMTYWQFLSLVNEDYHFLKEYWGSRAFDSEIFL